ncbi:MAG: glutamine-hydrolyzing GMP synthase [Oscillospiraceae bacterium]|jgi:GMP synthase (glutamine-hydrolysing)|nr:glutamine-hydrolyzing GMP synthase [Oscillospiraceae bacterium]
MHELILVLDFGGQYKQLIARRVRESGVYSAIMPCETPIEEIRALNPIGIILTGGPASVYADSSPKCDPALFSLGIPILGICYGIQIMTHLLGGEVKSCDVSEYGVTAMEIVKDSALFTSLEPSQAVLMSHTDFVSAPPAGFTVTAKTGNCPVAAIENAAKKLFGVQFHPEVKHTEHGMKILQNFLFDVCKAKRDYSMQDFIERQVKEIRETVGDKKVMLALSGGVDSSVCAALLSKAIPGQLTCVFVNHGFMRKNEPEQIEAIFSNMDLTFIHVNAVDRYMEKLKGVSDPEEKRKIIGTEFYLVFQDVANEIGSIDFLAQGTIYPDVIESGKKNSAKIKTHHNLVDLREVCNISGLIEPLRELFKDEVRKLGTLLGLPESLVMRQPFPGPGLAVRTIGDLTKDKLDLLREADAILREELDDCGEELSQYFAVLTNTQSVGVMGDERTYNHVVALRAITTTDFMTGEFARIPYDILAKISRRITNEVRGINRVVYDITSKPPATIEWE